MHMFASIYTYVDRDGEIKLAYFILLESHNAMYFKEADQYLLSWGCRIHENFTLPNMHVYPLKNV